MSADEMGAARRRAWKKRRREYRRIGESREAQAEAEAKKEKEEEEEEEKEEEEVVMVEEGERRETGVTAGRVVQEEESIERCESPESGISKYRPG